MQNGNEATKLNDGDPCSAHIIIHIQDDVDQFVQIDGYCLEFEGKQFFLHPSYAPPPYVVDGDGVYIVPCGDFKFWSCSEPLTGRLVFCSDGPVMRQEAVARAKESLRETGLQRIDAFVSALLRERTPPINVFTEDYLAHV
jgi:hypothetical protein